MSIINAYSYNNLYAFNSTTINVVDTLAFAITQNVAFPPTSATLARGAYNPNTNKFYISSGPDIYICYATTNALTTVATIGFPVNYLDINYETNMLYISSLQGSQIGILNCNSLALTVIPLSNSAAQTVGIAVNPKQNVFYVVDNANSVVLVYSSTTNTQVASVPVQNGPTEIVVNISNNNVYVANTKAGTISVINSNNQILTTIAGFTTPTGLACNCITNTLFVVDTTKNVISSINCASNVIISTSTAPPNSLQGPIIADDTNNCLYACATFSVYKVDAVSLTFPLKLILNITPTALLYYKLAHIISSMSNTLITSGNLSGSFTGNVLSLTQPANQYNANVYNDSQQTLVAGNDLNLGSTNYNNGCLTGGPTSFIVAFSGTYWISIGATIDQPSTIALTVNGAIASGFVCDTAPTAWQADRKSVV